MGNDRYIQNSLRMVPEDQFCDRQVEIQALLERTLRLPGIPVQSCFLTGPRRAGSSEIVKRVYRELFLHQDKVIPFYYRFERTFHDPAVFARDYLAILIRQYIAFRDKDPSMLVPEVISFQTVEKTARDRSDAGLFRLLDSYETALNDPDRESLVRVALHAPLILTESSNSFACMILDHLHVLFQMEWPACVPLSQLYPEVMGYERVTHLFTGLRGLTQRKFLDQESMAGLVHRIDLPRLTLEASLGFFLKLCDRYGVPVDVDAIKKELHRFHGIPFYIVSMVRRAGEEGASLTTSASIQERYREDVSRGEIAFYYDSLLNRCFGDPLAKRDAIRILTLPQVASGEKVSMEEAAKRVPLDPARAREIIESLILAGLLKGDYGMVAGIRDPAFADFLRMAQRFWMGTREPLTVHPEVEKEFPETPVISEPGERLPADSGEERGAVSFGLVLPMVSETELVAARALEQVAERVDFPEEEIGKIRMALIEACINAFEHSGSPDGKIYITFTLGKDKLTIVVEDRGASFDPRKVPAPDREDLLASADRRGWGIALIKSLMDKVVFEDIPVGTRLKMVKYFPKSVKVEHADRVMVR